MKKIIGIKVFIFSLVIIFISWAASNAKPSVQKSRYPLKETKGDEPQFVPDEVIVKLKPEAYGSMSITSDNYTNVVTGLASFDDLNKKYGAKKMKLVFNVAGKKVKIKLSLKAKKKRQELLGIFKIKLKEGTDIFAAISEYKDNPNVVYAEPNYIYQTNVTTPNDPDFSQQWGLNNTGQTGGTPGADIDAPEAWDVETGDPGVVVAVVDTGIDWDHPDLSANVWINPGEIEGNGIDDDANGFVDDYRGWDFVTVSSVYPGEDPGPEDNDPMDFHGHGTHVSGIIGAVTNNGVGIAGIAGNCRVMAVRAGFKGINGKGYLQTSDIANAITYAGDNGANIINMSFGSRVSSAVLKNAIDYVYAIGVTLIASAGNDCCEYENYPAAYDNVIAVGATDHNDNLASFSNYGPWISVVAPGQDIYSTLFDNTYALMSGTSMAAPHASGVAALILSAYPNDNAAEVEARLSLSAMDLGRPNKDNYYGFGRINAYSALTIQPQTYLYIHDYQLNDQSGDGNISSGETVNLNITLRNMWTEALNVTAKLQTNSPYVTIQQNNISFGNMVTGQVSGSLGGEEFIFSVNSDAPTGEIITLTITITADGGYNSSEDIKFSVAIPRVGEFNMGWNNILVDIDGDGAKEWVYIVKNFDMDYNAVYVRGTNGVLPGWPQEFLRAWNKEAVIAAGDVDGDGEIEVVVVCKLKADGFGVNKLHLYVWGPNGNIETDAVSDSDFTSLDFNPHAIALGDIDNDGAEEIIVATWDTKYRIYGLEADGNPVSGAWPREIEFPIIRGIYKMGLAVGDINNDGYSEIVITAKGNDARPPLEKYVESLAVVLDRYGNDLPGWEGGKSTPDYSLEEPVLADLDNDGYLEVIFTGDTETYHSKLFVYSYNGANYPNYPQTIACTPCLAYEPTVGDLDRDGSIEIIVPAIDIHIYDKDGFVKTIDVSNLTSSSGGSIDTVLAGHIALASASDDNEIKIIFGGVAQRFHAIDTNGQEARGWPLSIPREVRLSLFSCRVALGDVDGDGDIDFVSGANSEGIATPIFDLESLDSLANLQWPMYQHDPQRTGKFGDWDDDGVPDSIDNCPYTANPNQNDADGDDIGDACDPCTDVDGDGYGTGSSCLGLDCDDTDPDKYPGNPEVCDGKDNDCSGTLEVDEIDADLDGVMVCEGDCDDTDPNNYPGNSEVCDGSDNDCSGAADVDEVDGDSDGVMLCAGDCDDTNPDINPTACDIKRNGIDEDCDGADRLSGPACHSPGANPEVCYDSIDNDGDGYVDCDDSDCIGDPACGGGCVPVPEICDDGIDNDCDGKVDCADKKDCRKLPHGTGCVNKKNRRKSPHG